MAYVALTVAYVISGRLGLLLAVPPGYATAIFPPAGFAMAAMFIGGSATLPWTFLGSFLLNAWIGDFIYHRLDALTIATALLIAGASVLQAAIGGRVLRRLLGYPTSLDNGRDIARFFASSPVLCLTSATLSVGSLAVFGITAISDIATNWLAWWIGDTLGVLLFLPLTMVVVGQPRAFWRNRARSVALPMLLFFALFVAIFVRVSIWEGDQALLEFRLLSQQLADKVEARLNVDQGILEQLGASFSGPAPLSSHDFARLVRNLQQHFAAIQAVEWAPKVEAAQREQFEAAQRRELPGFEIRERDDAGQLQRAGDRAEFYPVTYIEPLQSNETVLGFDLASGHIRHASILQAVAGRTTTATEPISLVQAPGDQTGMLLILAVPDGPTGAGVILMALRMSTFVDMLLGAAKQVIAIQLIDEDGGQPLFDNLSKSNSHALQQQSFAFGTRHYSLRTAPTAFYLAQHRGWQSWAVLIVGVLSTSLLGAMLMLSTGERQRFARLLEQRTRERDRIWRVSEDLLGVGNFDGYFISTNPAWTRTLGWSEKEIRAMNVSALRHPDDAAIANEGLKRLAEGAGTVRTENRFRHKDGSYRWISWTMTAEKGLIYAIGRNVTADKEAAEILRRTEQQLRQAQKMESVGQLTGGIAHDFNNLLTVIVGHLDIIERSLGTATGRAHEAVVAAMGGAMRAVTLTNRLLAFAQKQPLKPRAVQLNELVAGMSDLIRRTQGEIIDYDFVLAENLPPCFCDANQLETALLNLVINARDAMPRGGKLKIETASVILDSPAARARNLAAGRYVTLAVSDTGIGMTRETAEQAFEPFFTTKGVGKGTGLGLSMVYGFVKQSRGHVEIDSALGYGTTVRIFLPQLAAADADTMTATGNPSPISISSMSANASGSGETILVVEDDDDVRGFVVEMLRDLNYRALEADDATKVLALLAQADQQIDLLLTDIVMAGINGHELADRATAMRPNIKILFMTGYSKDVTPRHNRVDPRIELIEKPFRRDTLAARIRAILDSPPT